MTPQNPQVEATILATLLSLKEDSSRNSARLDAIARQVDSLEDTISGVRETVGSLQRYKDESTGFFKAGRVVAGAIGGSIVLLLSTLKDVLFFHN